MENVLTTQPKTKFAEFIAAFPLLHLILVGVFSAGLSYATIQITQAHQAEKINRLESGSVSREIFDERTKTILERLEKQDAKLERILEKK